MAYREVVARVSRDMGLPPQLVDRAYKAFWRAVREHVTSLPLKESLTDDEFMELRPNVNIPSIGKLYVTLDRYRSVMGHYNRIDKNKKVKDKENVTHQED